LLARPLQRPPLARPLLQLPLETHTTTHRARRDNEQRTAAVEAATGDDATHQAVAAAAAGVAGPVPKKGGRGIAWIPEEALCAAKWWGRTTVDPIHGTSQTRQRFWDKMVENTRDFMKEDKLPGLQKRLARTDKRIEKMFRYHITQAVHKLNACLVSVHQRRLTGSPTEEDLLMAAVAL